MLNFFKYLTLSLGLLSVPLMADSRSAKIEEAVDGMSALAESGVKTHQMKPQETARAALFALALKTKSIEGESDFSWVGNSNNAWEADSLNWGVTTMKGAYSYVFDIDKDAITELKQPGNEEKLKEFNKNLKEGKAAFKLLLGTGVKFGVVPLGAVQCGVTFAALAIIDPHSGKIYVFAKEGSGC